MNDVCHGKHRVIELAYMQYTAMSEFGANTGEMAAPVNPLTMSDVEIWGDQCNATASDMSSHIQRFLQITDSSPEPLRGFLRKYWQNDVEKVMLAVVAFLKCTAPLVTAGMQVMEFSNDKELLRQIFNKNVPITSSESDEDLITSYDDDPDDDDDDDECETQLSSKRARFSPSRTESTATSSPVSIPATPQEVIPPTEVEVLET